LSNDPPFVAIENTRPDYTDDYVFGGLAFTKSGASYNQNGNFSSGIRAGLIVKYDGDVLSNSGSGNVGLKMDFQTAAEDNGNGNVRMRIQGDGKIGIGTLSPQYTLDVNGGARFTGESIVNIQTAPGVYLGTSAGNSDRHVSIISSDTNNSYIDFGTTTADYGARILYSNTDKRMYLWSDASSHGSFTAALWNGGVGVGTSSPEKYTLSIRGSNSVNTDLARVVFQGDGNGTIGSIRGRVVARVNGGNYNSSGTLDFYTNNLTQAEFDTQYTTWSSGDMLSPASLTVKDEKLAMRINEHGHVIACNTSHGFIYTTGDNNGSGGSAFTANDGQYLLRNSTDFYHKIAYGDGFNVYTNSQHGHFRVFGDTNTSRTDETFDGTGAVLRLSVDTASGNIGVTEGGTQIYSGSDQRLKTNVQNLPGQLDKINQLRPVSFDWKYTAEEENVYGFIAQEVQAVDGTVVYDMGETKYRDDKQYGEDLPVDGTIESTLAIHERQLIPMLVKAMQEMSEKIDTLQSQIETLQNK
jgi:hypothetical protein